MNPQEPPFFLSVPLLDWIAIGLLLLLGILGLFRGGAWQLRRFLGVLLSLLLARLLAPLASPTVATLVDPNKPRLAAGISYVLIFLFTLCILALLFQWLRRPQKEGGQERRRKRQELGPNEEGKQRVAGLCFGLLTALTLYSALITSILLLDPLSGRRPAITASLGARWTSKAIASLGGAFPLEARESASNLVIPVGSSEKSQGVNGR